MEAIFKVFDFLMYKFSLLGFTISFFDVMVFGVLASLAGYFIGSFFRR